MEDNNTRNMLFISHAWEDYEFTKWLALKLAKEGYGVWCDVTKLLGGENWPKEINEALQKRTCKFLFVLSKDSNTKPDPLGELEKARKVMKRDKIDNFIAPLKIDGILRDEVDYRLQEIQTVSFDNGWAGGLSDLLKMLDEAKIPKHGSFNPGSVNEWWKKYGTNSSKILNVSESLSSNRFQILSHPKTIYAHFVDERPKLRGLVRYPVVPHKEYMLSFTTSDELEKEEGIKSRIIESVPFSVEDIMNGSDALIKDKDTGAYYFKRLINQAFDRGLISKGLGSYKLSKGHCYFFHQGLLEDGRIRYRDGGDLDQRIKLWGKYGDETWRWALRGRVFLEPVVHYLIQVHILVSDGKEVRSAPKGVYKSWRNATFRDRLRASLVHLAGDTPHITFDFGSEAEVQVSKDSTSYECPVSYQEPSEEIEEGESIIDD